MKLWLTLLLLNASAAFAGQVDFSRHILDLDGNDIPATADKGAKPLDLASISGMALLIEPSADPRGSQPASSDKLARFNLALKIHAGGVVDVSSEEITLLKNAIGASYGPLVVGRAVEILDPPAKK